MIKKFKIPALIILGIFFLTPAKCQNKMLLTDYISQRFLKYTNSFPWEDVYLHTDKDEYIAGEDLWLSIYLIDRKSTTPSLRSSIAYFEILNSENKPVLQKRFLLVNGSGPGHVVLPDTLGSGIYTIRSYTGWMKNFLPDNCFMKDIIICSPTKPGRFRSSLKQPATSGNKSTFPPSDSALSMKVNYLKNERPDLVVVTDRKFRAANKNVIYLFIETHGIIDRLGAERILNDTTHISIPENTLTPGINHITIFDLNGPVAEKYIYTPEKEIKLLTISSDSLFKQRQKVTLDIYPGENSPEDSEIARLSISVAAAVNDNFSVDLDDYIVFGSEFGLLPYNMLNGRKLSDLSHETIDSILSVIKSRWINWETIFSDKQQVLKYKPETEYSYINGRLLTDSLKPVSDGRFVLMSSPGRVAQFQYSTSSEEGNFSLMLPVDYSRHDIIIQPDIYSPNQKIILESPFPEIYLPVKLPDDTAAYQIKSQLSRQIMYYKVRKNFGSGSVGELLTPVIPEHDIKRFYGKPDFELIMKNFITLDSLQEVFFELIPRVLFESGNSGYKISVLDPLRNKMEGLTIVMLDGVIIKDVSIVANLDPSFVEKIDVVWDKYRVGEYVFNGIVNIITKTGDFSRGTLPSDAVRRQVSVPDPVEAFVSPDYSSSEKMSSPVADYRSTLYWNPSVRPGENRKAGIEFWSSDIKSDYIINVNGITSGGKAVSLRKIIKVR